MNLLSRYHYHADPLLVLLVALVLGAFFFLVRVILDVVREHKAWQRAKEEKHEQWEKEQVDKGLTVGEAAAKLGCSKNWVRTLIRTGQLPAAKVPAPGGFAYRVATHELARFEVRKRLAGQEGEQEA